MIKILNFGNIHTRVLRNLNLWAQKRIVGLFAFNIIIMLLIVLRSAGYFHPFFPLTVNFIVFSSLLLSIVLLGAGNRAMFLITILFWILAAVLRIFQVEVWAERTAIYTFQAFLIGTVLFVGESIFAKRDSTKVAKTK